MSRTCMPAAASLVVLALTGFATGFATGVASAQVYSNSATTPIPDLSTAASTIAVSGGPTAIGDLNIIIDVDHRTVGHLDVVLIPPAGNVYIHLVSNNTPDGEDFGKTRFDQQSPVPIGVGGPLGLPPFGASYQPEGGVVAWRSDATFSLPSTALDDLASLNGSDANGTWTLLIDDDRAGNAGRLLYWSLELNGAVDPRGPKFGQAPVISGGSCTPSPVAEGTAAVFTLAVDPGLAPTSEILSVWGDASFAGGPGRTDFNDLGADGDAVAGDGVYSATIVLGAFPGSHALGAHVLDELGRSTCFALPFTVAPTPSGACCVDDGCVALRQYECDLAGGVFTPGVDCFPGTYAIEAGGEPFASIAAVGTRLVNSDEDDRLDPIEIGFPFAYYGRQYTTLGVSTNGNVQFPPSNSNAWQNGDIPNTRAPNAMIAPLWDDFDFNPEDGSGELLAYLDSSGGVGNRSLTISWENVEHYPDRNDSNSFQLVLFESGSFEFRYGVIVPPGPWASASVGFENATGTVGQSVAFAELGSGQTSRRIEFSPTRGPCRPECPPCAADFDQDGGVTGSDIGAFFAVFELGLPCGDVDGDGGVTGGDIGAFFQVYEAGGC